METPTKSPYSPSNILAHLEELKKWQQMQQERLIYQQKRQRDLLSTEQRRLYEAFGLNIIDSPSADLSNVSINNSRLNISDYQLRNERGFDLVDNYTNENNSVSNSNDRTDINDESEHENHENSSINERAYEENSFRKSLFSVVEIDGIQFLDNKNNNENVLTENLFDNDINDKSQITLDEVPIRASEKKFNELVEEHLRNEETNVIKNSKPKRPFLKRGQGLARFRMTNSDLEAIRSKVKEKSKPVKSKLQSIQSSKENSLAKKTSLIDVNNTGRKFNLSDKTPSNRTLVKKRNLDFKENSKSINSSSNRTNNSNSHLQIVNKENTNKPIIKKQISVQNDKIEIFNDKNSTETIDVSKSNKESKMVILPSKPVVTWSEILHEQNKQSHLQEIDTNRECSLRVAQTEKQIQSMPKGKENFQNIETSNFTDTESDISLATCERLINELHFKKDQEELKIFELLEEKAANSSFCSTSSVVQQLMDRSLKSTPKLTRLQFKFKNYNSSDTDSTPNCSPQKNHRPTLRKRLAPKKVEKLHVHFEDVDGNSIHNNMSTDLETTNESESYPSLIITNSADSVHKNEENTKVNEQTNFNDDTVWSDSSSDDTELNITLQNEEKKIVSVETDNNDIVAIEKKDKLNVTKQGDEVDYTKDVIFKSALLKSRLQDLEKEIEIFRCENLKLSQQKKDFETEKKLFTKKKLDTEKELAEEKVRIEFFFTEEKKKLAKEKMVFEKYSKEVKSNPNRKEREEIAMLKQEINELKEEIKVKDSKHGASQARFRNQIKNLEKELAKIKTENDNLKKENKKLQSVQKHNRGISNTKVLHEINKNLSKIIPREIKSIDTVSNKKCHNRSTNNIKKTSMPKSCLRTTKTETPPQNFESDISENGSEIDNDSQLIIPDKLSIESIARDSIFPREVSTKNHMYFSNSGISDDEKSIDETSLVDKTHSSKEDINFYNEDRELEMSEKIALEYEKMFGKPNYSTDEEFTKRYPSNNENKIILLPDIDTFNASCKIQPGGCEEEKSSSFNVSSSSINTSDSKEHIQEIMYPNGQKEIHYANGNVKTTSADGRIVKLLYYNGDIKETDLDTGTIKYFYVETKTLHITYIDGLEILEFNNGQVEKKYKDGSYEIKFPDNSIKYVDAEGNEKFEFPDGSTAVTNKKGEKIITFINGQREIHTQDHKRREYPDGTVKILYPDDTTETRYFNGRIRIRDKQGNLLMDSGAP